MKRNALAVLCVFLFAGCYTQFAYVNRAALEGVPPDSAVPADSASAYIRETVPANPNQVCYWTRDMWGRPQLVCEDAEYGRDWYRYSEYPWWNRSDPYFYGSYNSYGWDERCPAYYYYDNSCGACRYYSGYEGNGGNGNSWWWNSPSVSGRASAAGTSHPRRTRSSGVQVNPGNNAAPLNKGSSAQNGGGSNGSGGSSSGTSHPRRSRTDGINGNSSSPAPAIQELPKQQVQDEQRPVEQPRPRDVQPATDQPPVQQQPPPSSPPPSQSPNNGNNNPPDQNQNSDGSSRDRRNPRGF
jgi:hypothetical protein